MEAERMNTLVVVGKARRSFYDLLYLELTSSLQICSQFMSATVFNALLPRTRVSRGDRG